MEQEKKMLIITFFAGVFLLSVFVYENSVKYIKKFTYLPSIPLVFIQDIKNSKEKEEDKTPSSEISEDTKEIIEEELTETKTEPKKIEKPTTKKEFVDFKELEEKLKNARNLLESIKKEVVEDKETEEVENKAPVDIKENFGDINKSVRDSLVNIICTTESGGTFKPISGSGIIVSPQGVILTNAHIAQYYLLKDYPKENFTNCVIRTGAPARNKYKADLLYISNQWVYQNEDVITSNNPTGTGKNDYAFLLIKETTSDEELPKTFEYTPISISESKIKIGEKMLLASYPSGFLGGIIIQKELYPSSAVDKIEEIYTFETTSLDLFEFKGNIIAQKGSSGGAVVDKDNLLSGLIVTSSMEDNTGERAMRAITLSHIERGLLSESGFGLQILLNSNLSKTAENFKNTLFDELKNILVESIEN